MWCCIIYFLMFIKYIKLKNLVTASNGSRIKAKKNQN